MKINPDFVLNKPGKLEEHEMAIQAAQRELFEETGINIASESGFQSLGTLYIRKRTFDYVYHLFGIQLNNIPSLILSSEHCSYAWVSKEEAYALPLMKGAKQALDTYYKTTEKKF